MPVAPHNTNFSLQYAPRIAKPTAYKLLNTSSNGAGRLFEVQLPAEHAYARATQLVQLEGRPAEVGEAYGELVGLDAERNYAIQIADRGAKLVPVLDWLWRCSLRNHTSAEFLEELEGIGRGGASVGVAQLATKLQRMITAASLPEDSWNVQRLVANQAAALNGTAGCALPPQDDAAEEMRAAAAANDVPWRGAGHCDFFAAWGSRTESGRLLASRNFDIGGDTGLSDRKLVAVYKLPGRVPYATFGFAGFAGALAGMSAAGVAVSEANLDNSAVTFDGEAWPLKLRDVLGRARSLGGARAAWDGTGGNTAAFNFLLASAGSNGGTGPAAVALEAVSGFTAELGAGDPVEAASNFTCVNGTTMDGVPCTWPANGGRAVRVGAPLADAVFRSNHGLHPRVMATQEPLWGDTVSRYFLLRDRIARFSSNVSDATKKSDGRHRDVDGDHVVIMTAAAAVNITSLLGIKGPDYGSCAPSNTGKLKPGDTAVVLSAVYDPSRHEAYVAWEDGRGDAWRPASCATYQRFDFRQWFS